jgi:hypothetical protein
MSTIVSKPALFAVAATCAVTIALVSLPAASGGSSGDHLAGFVFANSRGPLTSCKEDGSNCTDANLVVHYLYVTNANPIVEHGRGPTRADVPNAFVVQSVDESVFVNGADRFDFTDTAPPGSNLAPADGHWVESAACAGCNSLGRPAVLPLENTAVFYIGWNHGDGEPDGTYVFKFTIHGTVNGAPKDVVEFSPPIKMTR